MTIVGGQIDPYPSEDRGRCVEHVSVCRAGRLVGFFNAEGKLRQHFTTPGCDDKGSRIAKAGVFFRAGVLHGADELL